MYSGRYPGIYPSVPKKQPDPDTLEYILTLPNPPLFSTTHYLVHTNDTEFFFCVVCSRGRNLCYLVFIICSTGGAVPFRPVFFSVSRTCRNPLTAAAKKIRNSTWVLKQCIPQRGEYRKQPSLRGPSF